MKYILIASLILFSISLSYSQEEGNWFTDKAAAIEDATTHNRNILMVFSGSDWCRPCIKFKKDILLNTEFSSYSEENLTILYLDFPAKKKNKLSDEETKQNETLAEQYNKSGMFPKIILTDSNLEIIKEISFKNQTAEDFLQSL